MIEIQLRQDVRGAIKKKGEDIETIVLETEMLSTVGLFHLKIRHFDEFLDYFLCKHGKSKEHHIEDYAGFRGLRTTEKKVLQDYDELISDFNLIYNKLKIEYRKCESKLMDSLCESERTDTKMKEVLSLYTDERYQKSINLLQDIFKDIVSIEQKNRQLFSLVNKDISTEIESIIKNPCKVYFNEKSKDLAFCSEEDEVCYVISLFASKGKTKTANIITGYRTPTKKLDEDMIRIYAKRQK